MALGMPAYASDPTGPSPWNVQSETLTPNADKTSADFAKTIEKQAFADAVKDQRDGRFADAVHEYTTVLSFGAKRSAYMNRAACEWELGDLNAAILDYSKAIALRPNDATGYTERGAARYNLNLHDLAIEDFTRSIEIDPRSAITYNRRALAYMAKNQFAEALSDLNSAEARAPLTSDMRRTKGVALLQLNRTDDAIHQFDAVVAETPGDCVAFEDRGAAYNEENQLDLANRDLSTAVALCPEKEQMWRKRGIVLDRAGSFDAAIADLTEAIRRSPKSVLSYWWRATAYIHAGQVEHALNDLVVVQTLDPSLDVDWARAIAQERAGNFEVAVDIYSRLQLRYPQNSDAWVYQVDDLVDLGRYDEAESDLAIAQRMNPTSPNLLYARAQYLFFVSDGSIREHRLHNGLSAFTQVNSTRRITKSNWRSFGATLRRLGLRSTMGRS